MLMASNLWVAEVCLPARTLRSVFGLSALVPPPQELVGGLVLARHDRHHHLGFEPHQVAHTLPALPPSHSLGPLVWLGLLLLGVQGTARPHNVPINSLEAAPRRLGGRGGGRRQPRHHTLGHYTPPHTTLLQLLLLNIVPTTASRLARYCSTMCINSWASKHYKSQRKDASPPKKRRQSVPSSAYTV